MYRSKSVFLFVLLIVFSVTAVNVHANEYNEAPMLAELVAEGKLPPVEERLPKSPLVIEPVELIGEYGGDMYSAIRGAAEESSLRTSVWYDPLVRWNLDNTEVIPGIAESWEVNENATEFTFKLREGIKWSDGHPLTSDHFVFYVNDIAKNDKLPEAPGFLRKSGEWSIEKIDDYTFTLKFERPNAFLLIQMATTEGDNLLQFPSHYVKQFHIDYNPDADKLANEAGFADWVALIEAKTDLMGDNPELPVLNAWVAKTPLGSATTQFVMERNPYYWKVDPEGNQLPYIDRLIFYIYDELEPIVLRTLNGEIDFMDRRINTVANKAVFFDNRDRGNYHFIKQRKSKSNWTAIHLNQTVNNPVLREIFRNKKFRIGLSHAINRQEIIDVVYVGQGEPWQIAPQEGSGFYNEKLAKQYTEYDVDLANKYLDEAGYAERDKDGWRLGPDGKPISFVMTTRGDKVWMNDTMEIVIPYWHKVGINAVNKPVEKSYQRELRNSNRHEALIDDGEAGFSDVLYDPRMHIPTDNDTAWGIAWYNWYYELEGDKEEPIPWVKKGLEIWDELQNTADQDKQKELMNQILDLSAENFPIMGICLPEAGYGIVSNKLRNVPMEYMGGWSFCQPGASNMCQFFFEGGSRK